MIEDLSVRDFALIDSVSLDIENGFTVLSGETGAGKSILIGSLSFLLGGKATADSIRTGCDEARVSGTVYLPESAKSAREWLADKNIQLEDNRVILRRSLRQSGKTQTWIQDALVTRQELADFTSFLVDMHGQHDHQSLLRVDQHRRFLDVFAGLEEDVRDFTRLYAELALNRKKKDELSLSAKERSDRMELLSFAVSEIDSASISENEEVELESEEQRLRQFEKLYSLSDQITSLLSKDEGIVPSLKKVKSLSDSSSIIDSSLSQIDARVQNVFYEIEDISESFRQYSESLIYDPARLDYIEERLSDLFKLKKKYGPTISDVLAYSKEAKNELQALENSDEDRAQLDATIAEIEKELFRLGKAISKRRKESALILQTKVEEILRTLGMPGTLFHVSIQEREGSDTIQMCGPWGFDDIEFQIAPNQGEPLRPLAKIASGGELSRIMLALKTVLADADETDTLIFDEIDTGIGGEIALAVGGHLRGLSKRKQVLCITHLASIAVRADNQIKIEKNVVDGKTITRASAVVGDKRIEEIARMLSGDGYSEASLQHATELLNKYR